MADAVTTQVLAESKSDLVVKFTNVSDGTGESAALKVDVSGLDLPCAEVDLTKVWFSTDGMAVRILWDADTDVLAIPIPQNQTGCIDFAEHVPGRLRNNAGTGKTGDIMFTTVGHTSGDSYAIILWMRKRQASEI